MIDDLLLIPLRTLQHECIQMHLQNTKRFSLCKNNNVGPKMHDPQDADYCGQLLEWEQQVMSDNRALILGTKYSYFQSWTHKTDSQTCQSNHNQHVPRYSWTVGNKNKLLLTGLFSDEVHLWQTIVSPGTSARDIKPTEDSILRDQGLLTVTSAQWSGI